MNRRGGVVLAGQTEPVNTINGVAEFGMYNHNCQDSH